MNTTYYKNLVMKGLFHGEIENLPEEYYLGFSASIPNADGTGVSEPSDTDSGYARIALTSMTVPENGVVENSNSITFRESTLPWGEMIAYVVYDASTGGNLLFYGNLGRSITVDANTVVTIPAGEMVISLLD